MMAFVYSVGNILLTAVLWNGGISFGGIIAFIFADRIEPIAAAHRAAFR